jgi:hypothetical protein
MTKSLLALLLSAAGVVLLASACDDGGASVDYERGWRDYDYCNQYTSCGTCTPVEGCGWCTTGVDQGLCAADPNECDGAQAFSWAWDPSGCFAPADAGVTRAVDAALPVVAPTDAAPQVDSASAPPVDAASGGSAPH